MMIRRMVAEDIPQVEQIERSLFSDAWSEQGFLDTLDSPYAIALAAVETKGDTIEKGQDRIIGYIIMYVSFEEGEISNVAVTETAQNQGIGSALLQAILEIGSEETVTRFILEVRVSNKPAIALYNKFEFEQIGIRRDFYEKPREDALIMVREKEAVKC